MTNLRRWAIFAIVALFASPALADESKTAAAPAVYTKTTKATAAQLTAWPGYYQYGVYYGSYRWRYQPYYTFYASPWFDYGYAYTPYAYGWPGYAYGPGYFGPYTFGWPYYGAYGYTYNGPVTFGY